jgi:phospholipid/cholesterol/gamma-HCH transport system permease protein
MGGVLVSVTMLDMPLPMFRRGLLEAVSLTDLWLGLSKAFIFGVIVSVSGCIRGLQCGNTAGAVGDAATSAVVTGITLIVAANALIDWIAALYGI